MLRFCVLAVILALASADINARPQENINNFEQAAPRDGTFDSYSAPLGDVISSGASQSWDHGSVFTSPSAQSFDTAYYPAPSYSTYHTGGSLAGLDFGAEVGFGGFLRTALYGIMVVLGLTALAQLFAKVKNLAFFDNLFEGRNIDPDTVVSVFNAIKKFQEKFEE